MSNSFPVIKDKQHVISPAASIEAAGLSYKEQYADNTEFSDRCPNGQYILVSRKEQNTVIIKRIFVGCNRWTCPVCRKTKSRILIAKLNRDCPPDKFFFLTLTLKKNNYSLLQNWQNINKYWGILLKRFKRDFPDIHYFRVVELTDAGMPHIHCLIDIYLPRDWIENIWREITGSSFIACFEELRSAAGSYISGYLTKSISSILLIREYTGKKTRIFQGSRSFISMRREKSDWNFISHSKNIIDIDIVFEKVKNQFSREFGRVSAFKIIYDECNHIDLIFFDCIDLAFDLSRLRL